MLIFMPPELNLVSVDLNVYRWWSEELVTLYRLTNRRGCLTSYKRLLTWLTELILNCIDCSMLYC